MKEGIQQRLFDSVETAARVDRARQGSRLRFEVAQVKKIGAQHRPLLPQCLDEELDTGLAAGEFGR